MNPTHEHQGQLSGPAKISLDHDKPLATLLHERISFSGTGIFGGHPPHLVSGNDLYEGSGRGYGMPLDQNPSLNQLGLHCPDLAFR